MNDAEKRERDALVRDVMDAYHAVREANQALMRWDRAHGFGPEDVRALLSRRDVIAKTTSEGDLR